MMSCLKNSDEDVHAPLLVTTSLLSVRQSVAVPPDDPSPSIPTVPVTESLRHGVVVPTPRLPEERVEPVEVIPVP